MSGKRERRPGDQSAADPAAPTTSFRRQTGAESVLTHFGMVGLLQEKGAVIDPGIPQSGGMRLIQYRRTTGATMSLTVPADIMLTAGDFLLVKSLTCPDGAVRPVAVRPPGSGDWVEVADFDSIWRGYSGRMARYVRWGAGAGSAVGLAALFGFAAPVLGLAGGMAALTAASVAWRDRKDRGRVRDLLK